MIIELFDGIFSELQGKSEVLERKKESERFQNSLMFHREIQLLVDFRLTIERSYRLSVFEDNVRKDAKSN